MALKTFRDPRTGKISSYDSSTQKEEYLWPSAYQSWVSSWALSWSPEDISKLPEYKRTWAGVSQKSKIDLADPESFNKLRSAIYDISKMKTWDDIKNQEELFGSVYRDPSSFWTQTFGSEFTQDKRFQEMSPSDQASIRWARQAAAYSQLSSLWQEKSAREEITDNVFSQLEDVRNINEDEAKAQQKLTDSQNKELSDFEKEWSSIIWDKKKWSVSWRNNNPWNLKFDPWEAMYWAAKDPDSAFAVFPTIDDAYDTYKHILTSDTNSYAWLDNDEKMWRWSWSGEDTTPSYTYNDLVKLWAPAVSKSFTNYTDEEWQQTFDAMQEIEYWEVWTWEKVKKDLYYDLSNGLAGKKLAAEQSIEPSELSMLLKDLRKTINSSIENGATLDDAINEYKKYMTIKWFNEEFVDKLYEILK